LQLEKGVQKAQKNGTTSLQHFHKADYHVLPYKDKSFDVFWSLESIEHSDDVPTFIREAHRVLKPGGRMVIAATFKGETPPSDKQKYQLEVGHRVAGVFNNFRTAQEVTDLITDAGFNRVANTDDTHLVMRSSNQMDFMCRLGLPEARFVHNIGLISQTMVDNTAWGTYQKGLFKSGVTSYNIISATKV